MVYALIKNNTNGAVTIVKTGTTVASQLSLLAAEKWLYGPIDSSQIAQHALLGAGTGTCAVTLVAYNPIRTVESKSFARQDKGAQLFHVPFTWQLLEAAPE